eukprot:GEMP01016189.1.p1 GENE.GEMP01016189.1~~GEMP01016189.1.p1  ORF type:complete len:317 (+),score=63.00 GEMP01016189.1:89-1039(+)
MSYVFDDNDNAPTQVASMPHGAPFQQPMQQRPQLFTRPLFAAGPMMPGQPMAGNPGNQPPQMYTPNAQQYPFSAPGVQAGMPQMHMAQVPRLAPLQMPSMPAPMGLMAQPSLLQPGGGIGQLGKRQIVVQLEVKSDFEPCLDLVYETNKPTIRLSAPDTEVYISSHDRFDTIGNPLYSEPLRLPLRFPNLHYIALDYANGARQEVEDVAKVKAPVTTYTGAGPTIRLRTVGTSGRIGFIDRGTSPKNRNPNIKPPKVGEGIFEYSVTVEGEILAEVSVEKADEEGAEEVQGITEMYVMATITLSGVITAARLDGSQ